MDLSIIVVSYNTVDMTVDCLKSVLANRGSLKIELIVVDNDSRDGSADAIEALGEGIILIRNKENVGFAKANNQGFRVATAPLVLLLNSDTLILGDVLQASVAYMREERNRRVGAFGCRVLNTDGTMQPTCYAFPSNLHLLIMALGLNRLPWPPLFRAYQMSDWQRDTERDVDVISGCYLLVRREVIDEVGPLDEDFFFFGEETDWCRRIQQAGWAVRFAPVGEIIHHGGGSARKLNHKRDLLLTESKLRLHRKHGGRLSAMVTFFILAFFNSARAVFWTARSLVDASAKARAKHFRDVCREFGSLWPVCTGARR